MTRYSPGMLFSGGSKLSEALSDRWAGQLSPHSHGVQFIIHFGIIIDGKALSGVTSA